EATAGVATALAAQQAAYAAHKDAAPNEPRYTVDSSTGLLVRLTQEAIDEHLAFQADLQAAIAVAAQHYLVPRLAIIDRLIAAGKLESALTALGNDTALQARWNAATAVYADDASALALLAAIDADPAVILARA